MLAAVNVDMIFAVMVVMNLVGLTIAAFYFMKRK